MALVHGKVNLAVKRKVAEVLWIERCFIIQYAGVSFLIKYIINIVPRFEFSRPRGKVGRKGHCLRVSQMRDKIDERRYQS